MALFRVGNGQGKGMSLSFVVGSNPVSAHLFTFFQVGAFFDKYVYKILTRMEVLRMLYALRKDTDELCLCPYCGALLQLDSHTTELDHVMPRHLWSYYRDLVAFKIKIQGPYRNYRRPEDSPKNLIYCCSTCNKKKSDLFSVPNWQHEGWYAYWGEFDLHHYAMHFYAWHEVYIAYLMKLKYDPSSNSYVKNNCDMLVESIVTFKREYLWRLTTKNWRF